MLWEADGAAPWSSLAASIAKPASFRFSEKQCLKEQGKEQLSLKKAPDLDCWPTHAHTLICMHISMNTYMPYTLYTYIHK